MKEGRMRGRDRERLSTENELSKIWKAITSKCNMA